jgi:hypothetical protein
MVVASATGMSDSRSSGQAGIVRHGIWLMLELLFIAVVGFVMYWHFLSGCFRRLFQPRFGHANYASLRRSAWIQSIIGGGATLVLAELCLLHSQIVRLELGEVVFLAGGFGIGQICFLQMPERMWG